MYTITITTTLDGVESTQRIITKDRETEFDKQYANAYDKIEKAKAGKMRMFAVEFKYFLMYDEDNPDTNRIEYEAVEND